jgi:ribonuclease D
MVSSQLISKLRELSRSDKFYIMQLLISELAQQETDLIKPDQSYPVWSPYDAVDASDTMLKVLHAANALKLKV